VRAYQRSPGASCRDVPLRGNLLGCASEFDTVGEFAKLVFLRREQSGSNKGSVSSWKILQQYQLFGRTPQGGQAVELRACPRHSIDRSLAGEGVSYREFAQTADLQVARELTDEAPKTT
jgi:hypothetical protein